MKLKSAAMENLQPFAKARLRLAFRILVAFQRQTIRGENCGRSGESLNTKIAQHLHEKAAFYSSIMLPYFMHQHLGNCCEFFGLCIKLISLFELIIFLSCYRDQSALAVSFPSGVMMPNCLLNVTNFVNFSLSVLFEFIFYEQKVFKSC